MEKKQIPSTERRRTLVYIYIFLAPPSLPRVKITMPRGERVLFFLFFFFFFSFFFLSPCTNYVGSRTYFSASALRRVASHFNDPATRGCVRGDAYGPTHRRRWPQEYFIRDTVTRRGKKRTREMTFSPCERQREGRTESEKGGTKKNGPDEQTVGTNWPSHEEEGGGSEPWQRRATK